MRDEAIHPVTLQKIGVVLLFFCTLSLFLWRVDTREIIGFESRFYLFALEMWQYGITWFPTTYQHPYPDYPVTSTIFIYLCSLLTGELNTFTAILPTAIFASLTLIMTYLIGALYHQRWGWHAVLFLLLTITFVKDARSLTLDFYPTFVTVSCFYLLEAIHRYPHRQTWARWLIPLMLLGFATRGPIGLVIPASIVVIIHLFNAEYKKLIYFSASACCLLIFSTLLLLGAAYQAGGILFIHAVLNMEIIGRMTQETHLPFYFYYYAGFSDYAPIFLIAWLSMLGIFYYGVLLKRPLFARDCVFKLCAWVIIILIGMSIPATKKIRYILPITPALALLAAYPLHLIRTEKYFYYLKKGITQFFLYSPTFFILTLFSMHAKLSIYITSLTLPYSNIILFCLFIQCIAFLIQHNITLLMCLIVLLLHSIYFTLIEPIIFSTEKNRSFIETIEQQRKKLNAHLAFYKENPDGFPIKYMISTHPLAKAYFINTPEAFNTIPRPTFFVTEKIHYQQLSKTIKNQLSIVASDHIMHREIIVLQHTPHSN